MNFVQERIDIESRLATGWTTTAIAWDNIPYVPTPGTSFVRCTILPGDVSAMEFGRDAECDYSGIIDIGIFVPQETGSATARGYADTLHALFHLVEFGTIDCAEGSIQNLGIEDGWYHIVVTISFSRRE